ncbi:MAG: histidine--tRNA ligase [Armatimonadetes bacterium]|nr:histidine--tRNA ligase [Armatimonadota bacterium]MDE2205966.1 histidine--tRNA ligase [Armatimonadota bacterium]
MRYTAPPYMNDVLPHEPVREPWLHTARWRAAESRFRAICQQWGYREIRTPIVEQTELFTRSIGGETDIVSKEMFSFEDRGGRGLTLKPEGTAGVVRAALEHGLLNVAPVTRLWYISPAFRYERGQRGRYRQHHQLGVEVFGAGGPEIDAEVILLALAFYASVGIPTLPVRINSLGTPESRAIYREALRDFIRPNLDKLSEEGRRRFEVNPLRMLDTKSAGDLELLQGAPALLDCLDAGSRDHFDELQALLRAEQTPFIVDPHLVRGFDYYTRTAFEIAGEGLGAQNALGGGGRYDGLVQECGGPQTPAIGFGLGLERLLISLNQLDISLPVEDENIDAFIVVLSESQEVWRAAFGLQQAIRRAGLAAGMCYHARKFKAQMKAADLAGARYTVLLGDDEFRRGTVAIRKQETHQQADIATHEAVTELKRLLSKPGSQTEGS